MTVVPCCGPGRGRRVDDTVPVPLKSGPAKAEVMVMRQGNVPPRRGQSGFTIVEVMVAAVVLMIGVLGTYVMIDGANRTTSDNNARTYAAGLGREILEQARVIDYESVAASSTPATGLVAKLREKASLTGTVDASGNWLIVRRGVQFTVTAQTCTFDDPSDGLGSPGPSNPCPTGAGAATVTDSNPDDFRRVNLTLAWKRGPQVRQITQTTQIVNPGGGLGPRITKFLDPNGGAQIGNNSGTGPTEVQLNAESTIASTVRWAVDDGRSSGVANMTSPGGKLWDWVWNIGTVGSGTPGVDWVLDGSYAANAQPFDYRGVPGELRVASVLLNRRKPLAPALVGAGRSDPASGSGSRVVELDWLPNAERDVIGYRVYRIDPTGRTRICPAPTVTSGDQVTKRFNCVDTTPPSFSERPTIQYEIVAVDRPVLGDLTSGTSEGDPVPISVGAIGVQLERPTNLVATSESGRPKLSWTPPPVPAGERILFYRIYRDGARYTRTVSDSPTFVDLTPTSTYHWYRVSAVPETYNEGRLSDGVLWP